MNDSKLAFVPIDLESTAQLVVRFRADSFACSFGTDERFYEADGKGGERYLTWLATCMKEVPGSCVHVWKNDAIIGQLEMGRYRGDPKIGYAYLYYLAPTYRNRGLGVHLDRYASEYFADLGFQSARLNVSPTNRVAMRFYAKNGWHDLGPRSDHPEVHDMQKELSIDA
jgi:ribosomal protein S18 acetylase RimI-like enzyme